MCSVESGGHFSGLVESFLDVIRKNFPSRGIVFVLTSHCFVGSDRRLNTKSGIIGQLRSREAAVVARSTTMKPRSWTLFSNKFLLLLLLVSSTMCNASPRPQWPQQNPEFYSNSYQSQAGYVPPSAFGNSNYGAFNRPFITRPMQPNGFLNYNNGFGHGYSGMGTATNNELPTAPRESEETHTIPLTPPAAPSEPVGPTMPAVPPANPGPAMGGMGMEMNGMGSNNNQNGPMPSNNNMGNMNQMNMAGDNRPSGMGAAGQMSGNQMNFGQNGGGMGRGMWGQNGAYGGSMYNQPCYGPNCPMPGMNNGGYDLTGLQGLTGMGSNIGQSPTEDYNSAEESAEIAAGDDLEQSNLRKYAEYLELVNRRYGIGMPGQVPNTQNGQWNMNNMNMGMSNMNMGMNGMNMGMNNMNMMGMNNMNGMGMQGTMGQGLQNGMGNGQGGLPGGFSGSQGPTEPLAPSTGLSGGVVDNGAIKSGSISSTGSGSSGPDSPSPSPSTAPSGMGSLLMSRNLGFGAYPYNGALTNQGYLPNVYENPYPMQWPMSGSFGALTNMGQPMNPWENPYGGTGSLQPDYGLEMQPYGYANIRYPQPQRPSINYPVRWNQETTTGPPVSPPELPSSRSREKSLETSGSQERTHQPPNTPTATSIQALTQQVRRVFRTFARREKSVGPNKFPVEQT
uniref:Uncharacterized protein n=1 Tax=Bursaphelenchus xylophilus TaxID=6326 RepID=A0A1I7S841_BURXY